MVQMRWDRRINSLFAEFPFVDRCYVSHVVDAVLGKTNERARAAKTRKLDGAFK